MNVRMISEMIVKARKSKGWSQEELAFQSNISLRTIQRIENCKTKPRAYTLKVLEEVLEINFNDEQMKKEMKNDKVWLIVLHLSSVFPLVFIPVIIWALKKDEIQGMDQHAKDVINFQITEVIYLFSAALLSVVFVGIPLLIALSFYCTIPPVINSIRIINERSYKYPLSLRFLK